MSDFLGADYVRDSRKGGSGARPVRTRYEGETLSRRLANSVEEAQRFDLDIVLRGDEGLRRRFFAHQWSHDIDKRFTLPVPQDPAISVPSAPARVRTKAAAGSDTLMLYSGSRASETLMLLTFFAFAGGDRLYCVVGDNDYELPTAGSVAVRIVPALDADAPTTARVDFAPTIPVKYADGDFAVTWSDRGEVLIRFTARNDVR